MKTSKWIIAVGTACILGLVVTGCAWSVGERTGPAKASIQPTKGQELIDLKNAHDQHVISDQEYEAQKNKILGK